MVAAFKKKNTIEETGFNLVPAGFTYRNRSYKFEDVIETRIFRSVLEHKVVLVGSNYHHSVSVVFLTKSGEELQVTEQPTWLSNSKISSIEHVEKLFSTISQRTWDARVAKYTSQVTDLGYFVYGGWRFYPNERRLMLLKNSKFFEIAEVNFGKRYGFITVREISRGLGAQLLGKLVNTEVGISTLVDTDVFFALLKHYFSISWND